MTLDEYENIASELRAVTQDGVRRAFMEFGQRNLTPHVLELIRGFVASHIEHNCPHRFELRLAADAMGNVSVRVQPKTIPPVPERDIDPPLRSIEVPEPDAPKARVITFQPPGLDGVVGAFISVEGMLAELERFRTPPDLFEGEPVGFRRAIGDVMAYLKARAR